MSAMDNQRNWEDIKKAIHACRNNRIKIHHHAKDTKELYKQIFDLTSFLLDSANITERAYCIINDITSLPFCKRCGAVRVKFAGNLNGYHDFCSARCSARSQTKRDKTKHTNLQRYGVEIPIKNNQVQQKMRDTMLKRHGVYHSQQCPTVREKTKATNKRKFGHEYHTQSAHMKEATKSTLLKKYGVTNVNQIPDIKQRQINGLLKKYGVSHPHFINTPRDSIDKLNNRDWLLYQYKTKDLCTQEIASILGVGPSVVQARLKKFCIPMEVHKTSLGERELQQYISTIFDNVIFNSREVIPPKEVDVFIPSLNIAIEFDGMYYHSELAGKGKSYHLNKLEACEQKNVRLINIWESEWVNNNEVVKSRLLALSGKVTKIHARNCVVKQITNQQAQQFLMRTHLQQACRSSVSYGLFHNDHLVLVMTFGKPRFNKSYDYELLRFSSELNTTVIGGASKVFKQFVEQHNHPSVISYSDRRWNNGKIYKVLGFTFINNTPPNYYYFHCNNHLHLFSHIQFQKHKLNKVLEVCDNTLTEWQNMIVNKYNRIWDCGNQSWVWRAPP